MNRASSTRGLALRRQFDHDPVNKIIYHGGDAVNAAEPLIKAGYTFGGHQFLPDRQNY